MLAELSAKSCRTLASSSMNNSTPTKPSTPTCTTGFFLPSVDSALDAESRCGKSLIYRSSGIALGPVARSRQIGTICWRLRGLRIGSRSRYLSMLLHKTNSH